MNPKIERPKWTSLLNEIQSGDTLVVWKLDRMGRSLPHLIKIVNKLISNNIDIVSLNDPINRQKNKTTLLGVLPLDP